MINVTSINTNRIPIRIPKLEREKKRTLSIIKFCKLKHLEAQDVEIFKRQILTTENMLTFYCF